MVLTRTTRGSTSPKTPRARSPVTLRSRRSPSPARGRINLQDEVQHQEEQQQLLLHHQQEEKQEANNERSILSPHFITMTEEERLIFTKEHPDLSPEQLQALYAHDKYSRWLYEPHSIIALVVLVAVALYVAFYWPITDKTLVGLVAVIVVFLFYAKKASIVQFPPPLFVRPHPAVWKAVTGSAVLYLCFMVFLLFQDVDDVRQWLTRLDPNLGKPLPEKTYGDKCELYTPNNPRGSFANLMDNVYDEFMLAHLLGWYGKTLMVRHFGVAMILSIGFELLELTFQHWLPNFIECWWDSLLLDLLICNALGMWLGFLTVRFMSMREYSWTTISSIPTAKGRLRRAILQLGPFSWDKHNWEILSGPKRLLQIIVLVTMILLNELNAFFLKALLWINPPHWINVSRLVLWWMIGNLACREYAHYCYDPKCKKLGAHTWVTVAGILIETLVCVKFSQCADRTETGECKPVYTEPFPTSVVVGWSVVGAATLASFFYFFFVKKLHLKEEK